MASTVIPLPAGLVTCFLLLLQLATCLTEDPRKETPPKALAPARASPHSPDPAPSEAPGCPVGFCGRDSYIPWPPPCSCEEECVQYGDCCEDVPGLNTSDVDNLPFSHPREAWSCREFLSLSMCPASVYMIDWCPAETDSHLASRCGQDGSVGHYTFLQDLPVKSAVSGIVYVNVFCARCHQDEHHLDHIKTDVVCNLTTNYPMTAADYRTLLAVMDYHPGHLQWTSRLTHQTVASYFNISDLAKSEGAAVECTLYLGVQGQTCLDAITTCAEDWPDDDIKQSCVSYTYHMYAYDKVYRNYDCAVCNYVLPANVHCSPSTDDFMAHLSCKFPSLFDLFQVYEKCNEPLVWNPLTEECENLITFCPSQDYNRNESIMYPNLTLYLNETQMTYKLGHYEFINEDYVRVCRPVDSMSVLSLVSTVLMLVSLVCMFLHMCIFLLQFKRRSVPKVTHFFMVCSLFIAELLFLVVFNARGHYVACVVFSCLTYYFFTVAFFWMNVISFDTCRAFYSHTHLRTTTKTLVYYVIYATGVPLVMCTGALLVNQLTSPSFLLHPAFGTERCWFNNKWGLVVFFICPVILILISNLCMYVVSIYQIFVQQKAAQFAAMTAIRGHKLPHTKTVDNKRQNEKPSCCDVTTSHTSLEDTTSEPASGGRRLQETPGVSSRRPEGLQERAKHLKVLLDRLAIYSKVALIMGLTWVFALISLFVDSVIVVYLNVVFNGLQGTFIFVAFNCTKENYRKLRDKITGNNNHNTEETFD